MPTKKCKHNIRKSRCKECGGSELCEHDKRRSRCKECKGGEICEHDKIKYRCKECGGNVFVFIIVKKMFVKNVVGVKFANMIK